MQRNSPEETKINLIQIKGTQEISPIQSPNRFNLKFKHEISGRFFHPFLTPKNQNFSGKLEENCTKGQTLQHKGLITNETVPK